ncbi:hypothetical protein [Rathayibacter sp. Leaf248]|uniref:hypothetical protein n=1 Tax=Rathayibacter sp. Leaf248 TaxID=2876555 RepID=UPI001E6471A6|nr:hypothetical protein [Rathayibacter sp. Leaf248]
MNVSGIDSSLTACGLARHVEGERLVTAVVRTRKQGEDLRAQSDRIEYVAARALEWLPTSGLFVIETPPPMLTGGLAVERHALYYLIVRVLLRRGQVMTVSQATRAMYATGSGKAKKPEVLAAMRAAFPDVRVSDDNAADALALLAMGSRNLGRPLEAEPISKKQTAAGAHLPWPNQKDQDR